MADIDDIDDEEERRQAAALLSEADRAALDRLAEPATRAASPEVAPAIGRPGGESPGGGNVATVYQAATLEQMNPRARGIEERLRAGDRDGVVRDTLRDAGAPRSSARRMLADRSRHGSLELGDAPPPAGPPGAAPSASAAFAQPRVEPAPSEPTIEPGAPLQPSAPLPPATLRGAPGATPPRASLATMLGDPAASPQPGASPPPPVDDAGAPVTKGPGPGLDAGLPSEEQIASARGNDQWRSALSRIANAMRVAAGRQHRDFEPEEDRLRTQRSAGMRERLAQKQQTVASERASRQEERQGRLDEQTAQRAQQAAEMQRAQLQLAQHTAERQDQIAEAQIGRTRAQTASEESERQVAEQRRDASSDISHARQGQFRALLQGLSERPGAQSRVAPLLAQVDSMSADDIDRAERSGPQWLRDLLDRRGARGAGGGGGGGGSIAAQRAELIPLVAAQNGGDTAAATALVGRMGARELAAARGRLLTHGLATQRGEAASERQVETAAARAAQQQQVRSELLPGVHATIGLDPGEAARVRGGFASAMGHAGSLRRIGELGAQFGGPSARISTDARARITPEITLLRGMVATLGQTGVINPSEVPAINAALPNPQDLEQMTFGSFDARLSQWRRAVEDRVRGDLSTRGVSPAETDAAIQALWRGSFPARAQGAAPASGGQAPAAAPAIPEGARRDADGNIVMYRPDGSPRRVPPGRFAEREAEGWTVERSAP
jgi:hypothetical protein